MKSLEHIIREIREGKCSCEKKKDSLEHAIRKVARKEYESSFAAKDSKPVDEGTDHSVYHVSWGPGLDHEVVARHGEEAVSKAKDALVAKTPKLKDPKYSDTFNKKPTVHNISKERNIQKEDVGGLVGSGTGGEEKLHAEDGKKKKDVKEAIGTLGTDKYQGNEFKSIRSSTPHIKPPGPEHGHSQAPENASRQRSIAKEKLGINRVTEDEQLDEFAVREPITSIPMPKGPAIQMPKGGASPVVRGPAPSAANANVPKSVPKGPAIEIPKGVPKTPKIPGMGLGRAAGVIGAAASASDLIGSVLTGTELGRAAGKWIGDNVPGAKTAADVMRKTGETIGVRQPKSYAEPEVIPGTAPETRPKPKEAEPKVAPKPQIDPGTVPSPAPDTKPSPAETPKTKPEPVKEPSKETKPQVVLPQIDVPGKVAPETATAPDTKAETKPKGETDKKTEVTEPAKGKDFSLPFLGAGSIATDTMYHKDHLYRPHESRGHAKSHRKLKEEVADKIRRKIENMPRKDAGDRKTIQYVGRPDAEPKTAKEKTSRLATIKNVIDEAKKVKYEAESGKEKKYVYPNGTEVVIGPDMKRNFLDVEDKKLPKDYDNK